MSVSTDLVDASMETAEPASTNPMKWRRLVFGTLVIGTVLGMFAAVIRLLGTGGGFTFAEIGMLVGFALTVPWNVFGFWNAVIGFVVAHGARDPIGLVNPMMRRARGDEPITSRVAVVMAVRNEGTDRVFRHMRLIEASLARTGWLRAFDFHILSDTSFDDVAVLEEARFQEWKAGSKIPDRLHYRRRADNVDFKAGNLREFCERWKDDYDFFVVLDADSLMSGDAILRLVRTMEANPTLGILQSLTVGLPSQSLFARIFQFGMRQGMRIYTMGATWWQGDCGPYWGHNAAIRLKPFLEHCKLPRLPGGPPLGGSILSHDQVEAVMMRRAGYEVRAVPEEGGSYEESPPSLPEFIKRDLRWCQGNMQYFRLLAMPSLKFASRVQMWIALFMYFGAPGWMLFVAFGLVQTLLPAPSEPYPFWLGHGLFWFTLSMVFMPIFLGVADVLLRRAERRRYGGAGRIISGASLALLLSILMAPIMAVAQTILQIGFLFKRTIRWEAQNRDTHYVPLVESLRGLWPQTLLGLGYSAVLVWGAPGVLLWAMPLLSGLLLAVPLTSLTSSLSLGQAAARLKICAIPEENDRDPLVTAAVSVEEVSGTPRAVTA